MQSEQRHVTTFFEFYAGQSFKQFTTKNLASLPPSLLQIVYNIERKLVKVCRIGSCTKYKGREISFQIQVYTFQCSSVKCGGANIRVANKGTLAPPHPGRQWAFMA